MTSRPHCAGCRDTGHVCENHPGLPWEPVAGVGCGAGMPCPACCSPVPGGGLRSITLAFTPDRQRSTGDTAP